MADFIAGLVFGALLLGLFGLLMGYGCEHTKRLEERCAAQGETIVRELGDTKAICRRADGLMVER